MAEHGRASLPSLEDLLGPGGRLQKLLATYEHRPQQIEAAEAISAAIANQTYCIVEAGTGVGKTLAYLIPAAYAIAAGRKAVISTYTVNLQGQLMEKDIPLLKALLPEVPIRACLLKGKGRYLCKQDMDVACSDLFHTMDPQFEKVREWASRTETGDCSELPFVYARWQEIAANQDTCRVRECRYYDTCHYYRARRIAQTSNLIVVNHALLMTDLVTRETSDDGSGLLPAYDILILDEAHHLEEAATSALSISLGSWELPAFSDRLRRVRVLAELETALDGLERLHSSLFELPYRYKRDLTLEDALEPEEVSAMRSAALSIQALLAQVDAAIASKLPDAEDREKERLEGLQQTARRLAEAVIQVLSDQPGRLLWCEVQGSQRARGRRQESEPTAILHSTPIELGTLLAETLWSRTRCAILTSATLATSDGFAYLEQRLGLCTPASEHVIGSPFDFSTQALLYVPAHLPPPPTQLDDGYLDGITEEIRNILRLTQGRAFLLFTSRAALQGVYARLRDTVEFPLFRQGDMPPQKLLDAFRRSGNGVLLGNQTFWEGVDVQGEILSAVVIDRIPFAVPDSPITKARADAIVARGGDPFREFSLPQAQIRLKQGFGRLIRTRTDRGIVCVLDSRLVNKSYGRTFLYALPPAARASVWSRVERFWHA